jgi:hypothetical protein
MDTRSVVVKLVVVPVRSFAFLIREKEKRLAHKWILFGASRLRASKKIVRCSSTFFHSRPPCLPYCGTINCVSVAGGFGGRGLRTTRAAMFVLVAFQRAGAFPSFQTRPLALRIPLHTTPGFNYPLHHLFVGGL